MRYARVQLAMVLVCFTAAASSAQWDLRNFNGRDYVSLESLAAFYHLSGNIALTEKAIQLRGAHHQLVFLSNNREANIDGINHWLSFPIIEHEGKYFISRMDLGKTIEPALRPELVPYYGHITTVVLDPGHGGHDNGAGSSYEYEKNFALDVARRVRNQLKASGVNVVMTRNSDTFIELVDRAAIANSLPNAIFVSIHFNSAETDHSATGFEIYCITPRGAPSTDYDGMQERDMINERGDAFDLQSLALACAIYHSMMGQMDMFDRGVKRARFAVLRGTQGPAVLVEGGFLSNFNDARLIATKKWRDQYAKAIADGILQYKRLMEEKIPPRLMSSYRSGNAGAPSLVNFPTATPAPVPGVTLREAP